MTKPGLTDERIFALIDAYGADPGAFPEAERDLARRRMAEAPALFSGALKEAVLLDDVLGRLPDVDVPTSLREALIAGAPAAKPAAGQAGAGWMRFLPGWVPAGAVASLVMGVLIGVNVSLPASVANADTEADAVMYAALGFGDYTMMDESVE